MEKGILSKYNIMYEKGFIFAEISENKISAIRETFKKLRKKEIA